MFIEDTYSDDRWVACADCGWGGDVGLDIVAYYGIEIAEWPCGECNATN